MGKSKTSRKSSTNLWNTTKSIATRSSAVRFRRVTSCRFTALQRLEKIMDEYVGGISVNYMTNEPLLTRGLELLGMLKEDVASLGAEDLHQLQRAWELQHRLLASECVTQHTLFRKETRWPGYYYRGDYPEAGRQGLALLHPFPLRSGLGEVGTGEGPRISHR